MEVNSQEDNLSNFYQHPAIPQNITNFFPDISSQDNPSSIYKNTNSTFTVHNSEMIEFLKNAGFPYPNFNKPEEKRDIPKIKIKDQNFFKDQTLIKDYISSIGEVDERQFSICRKCKKGNNLYYCYFCRRNLCEECKIDCEIKSHHLIKLINMRDATISKVIREISRIIYLQFKKKDNVQSNEKQPKIYKLNNSEIDDNKSEIKENIENYFETKDIELICRIIAQKHQYINYFHYKNILSCYEYIEKRYSLTAGKNCLKLIYDVQKCKEKQIQIFHPEFVKNNRDKLTLIIDNKSSELVETAKVNDKYYIEVILIQKPNCYLENLSKMFYNCERLIEINEYLLHDLIDFMEVKDISCMFMNCKIIPIINLYLFKNLFRGNKTINMKNLFNGCEELIRIEGLDTSKATSVENMFKDCKKYKILDNNTSIIKEDFEKAIKTKDFEILYNVIKSYMLSLLRKEIEIINFSKDNLTDIIKIINIGIKDIIDGISKCENLIPITKFIKKIFVEKKITDKELSKMIYDVFNDLYEKKDILEMFEIKFNKDEIKEIVDFYKNKK